MTITNPLLESIWDKLPELVQDRAAIGPYGDYIEIINVALLEAIPGAIRFEFVGTSVRPRRFPVRQDGTLNVERIIALLTPLVELRVALEAKWAEEQRLSKESSIEGRRLEKILFKAVKTGNVYRKDNVEHLCGGIRLFVNGTTRCSEIWANSETHCSGHIPFVSIPITKLNKILKILGEA